MNDILGKNPRDLTVLDLLEMSRLQWIAENPTMDIQTFCRITGKDRRRVNSLLNNRLLPEKLIYNGYEGRKQRVKVLFITEMVIEWLKESNVR